MVTYQSITTRYFGATDYRGSRIKSTSAGGKSVYVSWDCDKSSDENHFAAVKKLCDKFNWNGRISAGGLSGGGYVWIFNNDENSFVI